MASDNALRLVNAVAFAGLAGIFVALAWLRWQQIHPARRCMWLGFITIAAVLSGGSLEAAFLDTHFRTAFLSLGAGIMYVGAVAELRTAWAERRTARGRTDRVIR